ncbi:MAG: glucosidase [Nitrospirae bacterium]|nr:MAG: glucosidase [Nitrospirota bacterium]
MAEDKQALAEQARLADNNAHRLFWKNWGPYLSERQWGTVREDYSKDGAPWNYFPHDHARSRVYRWGEDGLGGISDIRQNLCFAPALWNGRDPILKERLFGVSSTEGNHGEDVKELYYYLDNTPTHSYMKYLYKYPQSRFPYEQLLAENKKRSRQEPEYELSDTGVFGSNEYFDVFIEYAKAAPEDILIRITLFNRAATQAELVVLPTLWFRNTWDCGKTAEKPDIRLADDTNDGVVIEASHEQSGTWFLYAEKAEQVLFTENETNNQRLFGLPNNSSWVKDSFHDAVVTNDFSLFREKKNGTKSALLHSLLMPAGGSSVIRLRLASDKQSSPFSGFDEVFSLRQAEADEFYRQFEPEAPVGDVLSVQRQAFAGLLWNKQYYNYEVETWLTGDKGQPAPPEQRKTGRNHEWTYLFNRDIISMPDKWEYPWYASWDLAFHCVPFALIDPVFAKKQLILLLREWYMHPNGQIPAYEWNFSDVNPPVHAWAALKVFRIDQEISGRADTDFLKRIFHKLLLNFTWWVNRKDSEGHNIFQGGFLGLDNIGAFDRSKPLPAGGYIEQADGTSWMAMYALNMMDMAIEIAKEDRTYEDVASKFYEHFVHIAESLNHLGETGLWHEEDGFYYDSLNLPGKDSVPLRVRSLVGLTSIFAVSVIDNSVLSNFGGFRKRLLWFRNNRKDLDTCMAVEELEEGGDLLLSLTPRHRLERILQKVLDEDEFLSPGGIRSISKYHKDSPFVLRVNGDEYRVDYEPAETQTPLFGGNSNWRGPVWVPINYLFVDALKKYHAYYGDSFKVEFPARSGQMIDLLELAERLSQRLTGMLIREDDRPRLVNGPDTRYQNDPHFKDLVLFHEYFHGDTCQGLGASHQTGWTGLVAEMVKWCWCR